MILHLVAEATWLDRPVDAPYLPEAFTADGFVHCTGDEATLVRVANAFYRSVDGEVLVLVVDEERLTSEVRWERPAGIDPLADTPAFPHVYGPIDADAVVAVRVFDRAPDGRYLAIG